MKFFHWMQRKLDHNALKGEFGARFGDVINHVKLKTESGSNIGIEIDSNTKALVEQQVGIWDYGGWNNNGNGAGLLTIGTFGFDPIINHFHDHVYSSSGLNQHQDDNNDGEEEYYSGKLDAYHHHVQLDDDQELNPLIMKYGNGDHHHDDNHAVSDDQDHDNQKKEDGQRDETASTHQGRTREIINMTRRRRKTLRDLFIEESAEGMMEISTEKMMITTTSSSKPRRNYSGRDPAPPKKLGLFLFPKKADHQSPSINKLNQMLRRMLKRKIHPELHGKPRKLEKEEDNKSCTAPVEDHYAAHRVGSTS